MIEHKIISKKFGFSNAPHILLNDAQIRLRDAIQSKIDNGVYKMEEYPCPCGSSDATVIAEKDRYGFSLKTVMCRACGIVRINPRLDKNALKEFYSREYQDLYFGVEAADLSAHFRAQRVNGLYAKDFIEAHCKNIEWSRISILEIGSSSGGILMPFLESGAKVRGYDYNERYLQYGRNFNKGLDLRYGGIDDVKGVPDRFDLVIINHVLEHLPDPKDAIRVASGLLREGGMLYLSVPSIKNAQYYASPTKSYLGSLHLAHLYHFSRNSLVGIIDDFEPIFVDEDIKGIFRYSPGSKATPRSGEFENNMRFMMWRENTVSGWLSSMADVFIHQYHFYTRAKWLLHLLRRGRPR